jgi:hypothetical protein
MLNKPFWDTDKIVSFSAFFISFGTFAIYLYQTHLIQKQQHASVLPYLEIENSQPDEKTYKLILANNGIGPAFIRKIGIHYQGKFYEYDPANFYGRVYHKQHPEDTLGFIISNVSPGRLIPANTQIEMILIIRLVARL